jgi:hypothetical protein
VFLGDLSPSKEYDLSPVARSLMSLNKIIVFLPLFIIVRSLLASQIQANELRQQFLLILALSGIIPSLAVILQSMPLNFVLIHNNPSFAETFRLEVFNSNTRPSGLSNEASFFAYQLFFCYAATLNIYFNNPEYKKRMLFIAVFYWLALLLSISRTGMLLFILYTIYQYFSNNPIKFKSLLKMAATIAVAFFALSQITIQNFNLKDRLLSSFVADADYSTIERYGVTQALFNLIIDKSNVLGIGIYNFQFYIKEYLPSFMGIVYYAPGQSPPSFNFILQLIAELGPVIFIVMFVVFFFIMKKADRFVKEWFVFLFLFALSFQVLNFTIPFIILLYPNQNENSLYNRRS